MKYIVNNEEVQRDVYYFCRKAKEENKTFAILKIDSPQNVECYINDRPEYDYYVCINSQTYYTKGEEIITEWYEKDEYYNRSKCSLEDLAKRFQKSKFKDSMSLEEWYGKNNWKYRCDVKYTEEYHDIPTVEDFKEEVQTKLFTVKVNNEDTVKTINEIRDKYGKFCIEYVLRTGAYTEIIYEDNYLEI